MTLLKLPYVKEYRDRHGRVRRYVRRRGQPDIPLPGRPAVKNSCAPLSSRVGCTGKAISPHPAGSFAKLLEDYYRSVEFANLKPNSQRLYHLPRPHRKTRRAPSRAR